jgi:putative ABC transport system permease protein
MDRRLQSFPYRTYISLWVFGVAGIIVVLVAFLSVAFQALKASMTKSAETLKYE